jgi:type IV secretory pathway VirB2 component (pilin)
MKKFFVLLGLMMIAASAANAASVGVPPAVAAFFDTIIEIVVQKGILLGGIGIIVVGAVFAFVNKSWSPLAYSIVGVIFMVLASPFIASMIGWSSNVTL